MDHPFQSPRILSFCPGILGLERGLTRAIGPIRVAAYVEIESFIIANLLAGMETGMVDPAPIWTDATTFDARPFRGKIHGIIGGYPCPGESLAGLREGHLYEGFIWPHIRRAIRAARPLWCFFENVDDHLTGTYPIVQRSLQHMGYHVEAGIYSAAEAGATHERQRLFILAMDNSCRNGLQQEWSSSLISGETMADGICQGLEIGRGGEGTKKLKATKRGSKELADTLCDDGAQVQTETRISGVGQKSLFNGYSWRDEKFPAGQGEFQYEWEEPRTTERGLGDTINGYHVRESLLRAIGNSVVEQTAHIAFLDLMRKHMERPKIKKIKFL